MTFDELARHAVLGTGRGWQMPSLPSGALADAMASIPSADLPEDHFLSAAAMLPAYETCGHFSDADANADANASSVAPPDEHAQCSTRAAALLEGLLKLPSGERQVGLLDEWMAAAAASGVRPPHELLPALLTYGMNRPEARRLIADVIDRRGRWLIERNPEWQGVLADSHSAPST